ncbi:MAG: hypothetical protein AVDCRST_MAG93-6362 [uncultured Chloroflexia bacterium]|uniref:Uncharacterized protein n=1 Tax=uncultured Chloroflexia bacterium TaxID=1672391 RepID=A0A6J4LIN5_9CHLR|nr:MAG: hypothetical protein AVDCRST_MAG93-6362 [uncultured Chloroflexia bacterium]
MDRSEYSTYRACCDLNVKCGSACFLKGPGSSSAAALYMLKRLALEAQDMNLAFRS